ncbi:MAG: DNA recombination protein RmuC [Elusimicrobiales bacterium]|nr:DNA recombination protein RmuC [Elusimicrobiales bacterium]
MTILYILIALVIGAILNWAITYFYLKNKHNLKLAEMVPGVEILELKKQLETMTTEKAKIDERAQMLSSDLDKANIELAKHREEIKIITGSLSGKNAEFSALNEKLVQQKAELENMRDKLSTEFENVANKIFEAKNKTFRDQSQTGLNLMLSPLKDKIKSFEERVNQIHHEDTNDRGSLLEKITQLTELNNKVNQQAENLTSALRGKSKIQGDWGEMVLEEMLQAMGLEKGTHYAWQKKIKDEDDPRKSKQPDIIINLPDSRHIVVDSKVSLSAYNDYYNTDSKDEASKHLFLGKHLESVSNHISELAAKDYHDIYSINSLDFVLMFMPIEGALHAALEEAKNKGRDLFKEAFEKNIILVSTSTLFPVFKTIAYMWQQEKQNRNALEIARKGGDLYDKFVLFISDFQKLGKSIDDAHVSYENAVKKLSTGRGNMIKRAIELKELGAKATKELPVEIAALDND